jgi:hypothetical protein
MEDDTFKRILQDKQSIYRSKGNNTVQLVILIGNDFNSKFSELQITIRKKNVVPCPKRGNVTHALSEARW